MIIVIASGGLDSTVLLQKAVNEYGPEQVKALWFSYNQTHCKEFASLMWQIRRLGIRYDTIDLTNVFDEIKYCPLLKEGKGDIPEGEYKKEVPSTYVPFRNGLFLSAAASIAYDKDSVNTVWYGAHRGDTRANYPDCTEDFVGSMKTTVSYGTGGQVDIEAPLIKMTKAEVVAEGIKQGMTAEIFRHTWSCYKGGTTPCGKCATCIERRQAFLKNGMDENI